MIIPVYKPLGASSHQLAKTVGEKCGEKATHTGTLDPMAEGVLIVLTGKDRFEKNKISSWKKEYEFELLIGFETDSLDLLGLVINNFDSKNITKFDLENLENILKSFVGKQTQTVPKFSAQRIDGKSGFDLAKIGKKFKLQKNKIEIFNLEILENKKISEEYLLNQIIKKINKVEGDFRQKEILIKWKKELNKTKIENQKLPLIKLRATTSKRTYIRSLARDIGKKLKLPITVFSIVRTKNGKLGAKL